MPRTAAVDLRPLKLSQKPNFSQQVHVKPQQNVEKRAQYFYLFFCKGLLYVLYMIQIRRFSRIFSAMALRPARSSTSQRLLRIHDFRPLQKFSYIIEHVPPPNKPILDRFPYIFLLAPCYLVLINFAIVSCLTFVMFVWQKFFVQNLSQKVQETL